MKGRSSADEVSASIVDIITNHELIDAFGTSKFEISRFGKILDKERRDYSHAQLKIDGADVIQRSLLLLLPISIVLFLIFSMKLSDMTAGSIASLFSFTLILTTLVGDFGKGFLAAMEMTERINVALSKLLFAEGKALIREQKGKDELLCWDVHFKDSHFSYGKNNLGVTNINLHIQEKEKVGIVGYSGAGKTTLIKLLRGYYKLHQGQILIGGKEISKISHQSLTQNIVEVSQTSPLFHRSIKENVAYGCEHVSETEVWKSLDMAQFSEYVKKLPDGLDSIIGIRGQKISGGERARICIARALFRKAKIVIFDEATAAIDAESEIHIQKALDKLMENCTLIAIAHRLSTLRKMDRIIVLDKGRLIAEGSHENLLKNCQIYKRLWEAQIVKNIPN